MTDRLGLDPIYFNSRKSWEKRLESWLKRAGQRPFYSANRSAISKCLEDRETGLRMVVNIPADALMGFLQTGVYLNGYENPLVGGKAQKPSRTRIQVDELLQLGDPCRYYFGAVAIGGTGVRFYGEYCMVLRRDLIREDTRVLDRDSYDLILPPFSTLADTAQAELVATLRGTWSPDLVHMLILKLLPALRDTQWLVTLGTISDAILHDEEFAEVHLDVSFAPADLEEVRQAPEEEALASHIATRYRQGVPPCLEELIWTARRAFLLGALAKEGIASRIVVSSGRGNRWR